MIGLYVNTVDKILVLDFGDQYNQLIARRVRSQQVYAEINLYNKITPEEIKDNGYKGIIFTSAPNSVYDETLPHYDPAILNLGVPIFGICYSDRLMAYMAGGEIPLPKTAANTGRPLCLLRIMFYFQDYRMKASAG